MGCKDCTRICKYQSKGQCSEFKSQIELNDHLETVNWIQYSSFGGGFLGRTTKNYDGREFIVLPSGKKIVITIIVETLKDFNKRNNE